MLLCILRNQWTAVADNPRLSIEVANPTPPPQIFTPDLYDSQEWPK